METMEFSQLLKRKKGTIFTIIFVVVILTLGISLLSPLKYGARSRLLVVQNISGNDPYTISRSNEYLGSLLSQVIYSGSFYNLVLESQYDIDKSYFSGSYREQIRDWGRTVQTRTISDTGIIEVNVFHPSPYQAQQITLAINDVLINKNSLYQGGGQGVKINIIDQPLVSSYPVKPNLLQNGVLALAGSLCLALFYIYLWPEEKYDLRLYKKHRLRKTRHIGQSIRLDYYPADNRRENVVPAEPAPGLRPQGDINNVFKN